MGVSIVPSYKVPLYEIVQRSPEATGSEGELALANWLDNSEETWFGLVDGRIACVWGLVPPTIISDTAYLWLLTTDIVAEHKFLFIRHSQVAIEDALKRYPRIVGHVAHGNRAARRWLQWLGAEIGESDGKAHPFIIRKH